MASKKRFWYFLVEKDAYEQVDQKFSFEKSFHVSSVEIVKKTAVPEEGRFVVECRVTLIPMGSGAGNQVIKLQAKRFEWV